ncbi:hypothetical protein E2320_022447 [Naja naja]|nr:hypothetical protein E2320_022447 [Naja naja]
MGSEALSSLAGLTSLPLLKILPKPLQLPMTAMPPCWKRSQCTLTQLLFGLLCSLATLLVLSFLASIRPEDPHSLLSQMGSGVGEQFIDTLLQPPPNAFRLSPSPCALTTPWLLVLVPSAPGHAARRQARHSWGCEGSRGAQRAHGFHSGAAWGVAQQAALERTAEHGDLLQAFCRHLQKPNPEDAGDAGLGHHPLPHCSLPAQGRR